MKVYTASYSGRLSGTGFAHDSEMWNGAECAMLEYVRPESSGIIPTAGIKLLYSAEGIGGVFNVKEYNMVCRTEEPMGPVWQDSCVEFFVKPAGLIGYFNFEFNCIGVVYASYVINPERTPEGFKEFKKFIPEDCREIRTDASIKEVFNGEITGPKEWSLSFFIPYKIMELYSGSKVELKEGWECNFYKCADGSTLPHWLSWSPVEELNFHAPQSFGKLAFTKRESN